MDNKKDRFIRIAEARTNKIIDMLRLLGNCSNKNAYEYSDSDVEKIFQAIEQELKNAHDRFKLTNSKGKKFKI